MSDVRSLSLSPVEQQSSEGRYEREGEVLWLLLRNMVEGEGCWMEVPLAGSLFVLHLVPVS